MALLINDNVAKITAEPGDLVAPCGCMLVTRKNLLGEDVVTLIPHDINCPVVQASIDTAIEADRTVNLTNGVHGL